jgi:hypothetical protein
MADKQSGFLVTLGKRLLGFNTSSRGCCTAPTAEVKKPEAASRTPKTIDVVTPDQKAAGAGCCAPSCCSADDPADARRA